MGVYENWKREVEQKFRQFSKDEKIKEELPGIIKQCPQCGNLTLRYNKKTGKIYCTECGFEEKIPLIK